MAQGYSGGRVIAAWGVHLYTALGLPLAVACVIALAEGDARQFFLWSFLACLIDSTDGFLARAVKVKEVIPDFSGRRLDDIIDFLHFVCLPMMALPALGVLPRELAWIVALPLMASGYGFSQEAAKTDDAFVGFPSYWNIVALYVYVLDASATTTAVLLVVLSVLVFVPVHYIYPSRTPLLRPVTIGLGVVWAVMLVPLMLHPEAAWAARLAWVSLLYPVYYTALSLVHHRRVMAEAHG
ncbi:MAG: hypothetical protein H6733_15790 [Alphaproteobacteria bacterium]|nr:hypothetical protein [Alphaproteobacteria bacterium]